MECEIRTIAIGTSWEIVKILTVELKKTYNILSKLCILIVIKELNTKKFIYKQSGLDKDKC